MKLAIPARPDSIVVRCARRTHRVRLARGRFWRRARCPSCGAPVDRWRVARVGRALIRLLLPSRTQGRAFAVWVAAVIYLAWVLLSAAVLWLLGDRWWLATGLLFGPRWLLLLPLPILVAAAALTDRALGAALAAAGLIVAGPIMGFRTGWRGWLPGGSGDDGTTLRIGSFNAQGDVVAGTIRALMLDWQVDILGIQECGSGTQEALQAAVGWHVDTREGICLASRFPIVRTDQMDREAFQAADGSGLVATSVIDLGRDTIRVTNIHLDTPRPGLERLKSGDLARGLPALADKLTLREIEHRHARRWAERYPPPHIVVGDFNAPVESAIYRASWSDWTNAFSAVGRGFGATKVDGWIRVRIDHILTDRAWRVRRAWVGPGVGSDHRPMLAEIQLRNRN